MTEEQKRDYDNLIPKEYRNCSNQLMKAAGVSPLLENERLSIIEQRVIAKFDEAIRDLNKINKQGGFMNE